MEQPPLSVGPVKLPHRVILAPMSGVTDAPFRQLVKEWGGGLVVSEMIASQAMIRQTRQSLRMARRQKTEGLLSVQLAGCDPQVMAEAAKLNEDMGADIIDINMGCPVKKVVNGHAGSALMKDEALAARLIEATVKAVSVPVSLKMRTGWNSLSRNACQLAKTAESLGIQMITVHGRTRCQLYHGEADWDFISAVKKSVRIPVIGNGDLKTPEQAYERFKASGVDGIMVGRGAYGRPWLIGQMAEALQQKPISASPSYTQQHRIVHAHFEAMLEEYGKEAGLNVARKHLGWYSKGHPSSCDFRARVNQATCPQVVRGYIDELYQ